VRNMSKVKSVVVYLLTANPALGEAFVKVGPKAEFQDESVPFFIGVTA
jgi:gamma-glutamylcysteine synthetase